MPTRARKLVTWAVAMAAIASLLLSGCSAPTRAPLTRADKDAMCSDLGNEVTQTAATAAYSAIYLYRDFSPSVPHGTALPRPDCAYLARSEFVERLEVFYFAPSSALSKALDTQLHATGFQPEGDRWVIYDFYGQPQSFARIEQFYAPSDASVEFRRYAQLIGRPALVLTFTTRTFLVADLSSQPREN